MQNQSDTRKKMLGKIHIAKSQLGLDDDVYRDLLENVTGLRSCSKMTVLQLEQVLTALKSKGFQDNWGGVGRMPMHQVQHRDMMKKIAVLLKQIRKTWSYAESTARNMCGKDTLVSLDDEEMYKLVSALQIHVNRQHVNRQKEKKNGI